MIPNYSPTPEDRAQIAAMPTEQLAAIVGVQLVPSIVEIMVDELNARFTAEFDLAYSDEIDEFSRELDLLLAELSGLDVEVTDVEDDNDDYLDFIDDVWGDDQSADDFWADYQAADDFYGDDEEGWS